MKELASCLDNSGKRIKIGDRILVMGYGPYKITGTFLFSDGEVWVRYADKDREFYEQRYRVDIYTPPDDAAILEAMNPSVEVGVLRKALGLKPGTAQQLAIACGKGDGLPGIKAVINTLNSMRMNAEVIVQDGMWRLNRHSY